MVRKENSFLSRGYKWLSCYFLSKSSAGRDTFDIIGDGSTKEFIITHNRGHKDLVVQVRQNWTGNFTYVGIQVEASTDNAVVVSFGSAPAVGENFRVIIL